MEALLRGVASKSLGTPRRLVQRTSVHFDSFQPELQVFGVRLKAHGPRPARCSWADGLLAPTTPHFHPLHAPKPQVYLCLSHGRRLARLSTFCTLASAGSARWTFLAWVQASYRGLGWAAERPGGAARLQRQVQQGPPNDPYRLREPQQAHRPCRTLHPLQTFGRCRHPLGRRGPEPLAAPADLRLARPPLTPGPDPAAAQRAI